MRKWAFDLSDRYEFSRVIPSEDLIKQKIAHALVLVWCPPGGPGGAGTVRVRGNKVNCVTVPPSSRNAAVATAPFQPGRSHSCGFVLLGRRALGTD